MCHSRRFGFCGRSIDVRHERVEPDDRRSELGVGRGAGGRAERQRAGQEVDAEIEAGARDEQILDLGIGLGASERRVELDEREPWYEQPERTRELSGDDLGDERLAPLTCPAELEDVEPVVARFHERGE